MSMNEEIKKVVGQLKQAQVKLQKTLKGTDWVGEVKKYADSQGKELKKILSGDVQKVKTFVEKEKKILEGFQKQIPGEVEKLKTFVHKQRREVEKMLRLVKRASKKSQTPSSRAKPKSSAKPAAKKTSVTT